MKKILLFLILMLVPSVALAFPFLVCDPQAGVEYYVVTGLPAPIDGTHVAAQADGSLRLDLATLNVGGPYSVKASACQLLWGCSADSNPFGFSRPAASTVPAHLRLSL